VLHASFISKASGDEESEARKAARSKLDEPTRRQQRRAVQAVLSACGGGESV
jgi:hypothetical protein